MDIMCGNCGRHYATAEEVQYCACNKPDKIEMVELYYSQTFGEPSQKEVAHSSPTLR
jgi:hypothetical protein